MRRSPSPALPALVEQLLVDVVADGFALYCCGPKAAPHALVACYEWDHCVDLLTIHDFDRVSTARVPAQARMDICCSPGRGLGLRGFAPAGTAGLAGPRASGASRCPHRRVSRASELARSRAQQRPMTIQLPSPGKAGMRAARLATAMPGFRPEQQRPIGRIPRIMGGIGGRDVSALGLPNSTAELFDQPRTALRLSSGTRE